MASKQHPRSRTRGRRQEPPRTARRADPHRATERDSAPQRAQLRARRGKWLWTTREGSETDLAEELAQTEGISKIEIVTPGIVVSDGAPIDRDGGLDVTFARQGFPILATFDREMPALARACADVIAKHLPDDQAPLGLHAWVPDTTEANPGGPSVEALRSEIVSALQPAIASRLARDAVLRRLGGYLAQVALRDARTIAVGLAPVPDALSLVPGGRARMHVDADAPSRAARKVEEALAWLGVEPGPSEVCVDLGAAPGGWTWALLQRRARVIAIDPAELREDLRENRLLTHLKASAFEFAPEKPVDWLFCDMAWRPLEAAALLAKWGRRGWAKFLVANLKLPMKKKAEMVGKLRAIVEGPWRGVRTRQLYHDRDEITLTAHR